MPACTPLTYKVTTDPALDETKTTFKAHNVVDYLADGNLVDDFNSVSKVTFLIIPSLLGVTVEEDKSIIAGTAFDINGKEIEGAQVVVYVDGQIPDSLVVKYFVENFPNRDQPYTSPDGLWVAVNVPAGEVRAEMWGVVDGELQLLGATVLTSQADSINIGNIYTGYADGVYYPASCYE